MNQQQNQGANRWPRRQKFVTLSYRRYSSKISGMSNRRNAREFSLAVSRNVRFYRKPAFALVRMRGRQLRAVYVALGS